MIIFSQNLSLRFVVSLFLVLILSNCSGISTLRGDKEEAVAAAQLAKAKIANYRFRDLSPLTQILKDRIVLLRKGLAYLKKETWSWPAMKRVPLDHKMVALESKLNLLAAEVKNILLYYPHQWEKKKHQLNQNFEEVESLYREIFSAVPHRP